MAPPPIRNHDDVRRLLEYCGEDTRRKTPCLRRLLDALEMTIDHEDGSTCLLYIVHVWHMSEDELLKGAIANSAHDRRMRIIMRAMQLGCLSRNREVRFSAICHINASLRQGGKRPLRMRDEVERLCADQDEIVLSGAFAAIAHMGRLGREYLMRRANELPSMGMRTDRRSVAVAWLILNAIAESGMPIKDDVRAKIEALLDAPDGIVRMGARAALFSKAKRNAKCLVGKAVHSRRPRKVRACK